MTHEAASLFIFWISLLFGVPLAVTLCRLYKPLIYLVFALLIFSTAFSQWSISFESRESYKSVTRGFTTNFSDLLCIVLAVSLLLRPREYRVRWLLPISIPYAFFFLVGVVSWVLIPAPLPLGKVPLEMSIKYPTFELWLYPLFELSRILWGGLLFWTVANFLREERAMKTLVGSIIFTLTYLFCDALINRYVYHAFRASASQFSVNEFNLYVGMLGIMIFPFAFSSRRLWVSITIWCVQAMVLVTIILTISRSSLVGYFFGAGVVALISLFRYPSVRNIIFILLAGGVTLLLLAKASRLLLARFETTDSDLVFRQQLTTMALLMVKDYPFGVGLGNYAAMAYGKYSEVIGIPPLFIIAHNIWYLTLAETGLLGLFSLILIWIRYYQITLVALWRSYDKDIPYGFSGLLGCLCATIPLHFQDMYHFTFRINSIYLISMIMIGTVVGIYMTQREIRRTKIHLHNRAIE